MFTGIDIITFDFKPVVREVSVLNRIKRCHIAGVERIIAIAALEDPAIGALRTEIILDISEVLTDITLFGHNSRFICCSVNIDDRDIQGTAVIGGVAFRVHHEIQHIQRRDCHGRNPFLDQDFSGIRHIHMLIEKLCVILEDLDADPIREIRHAVVLFKLCIAQTHIHISAHRRVPCQNRIMVERRMNEVLLDCQGRRNPVDIFAVLLMGNRMAVRRIIAIHIHPAVGSLFAEIFCAVGIVVCSAGIRQNGLFLVYIRNSHVETAAVICVVCIRIDNKVKTFQLFDLEIIELDQSEVFLRCADRNILKLLQFLSLVDKQLHAVRIGRIRVAVDIFHICDSDIDLAVLGCAPFQNRRNALCGMNKVILDLQAVCAGLGICFTIEAFHPV